jgi:2,4-dichlorophenol 6-monooxygenase
VGLAMASLLRKRGIDVAVFERRAGLHKQPQAHVINTRTMEVFREIGVDRRVAAAAPSMARMRFITWCESLAGREFGRLSLLGKDPSQALSRLAFSPVTFVNLAQNKLEPILHSRAVELGADVYFGHTVANVSSGIDKATMLVTQETGEQIEVEADFVIACDGAGSTLRSDAGIVMEGPSSLQKFITVYFEANLDRVLGGRPGPVHWLVGSDVRGVLIGFDAAKVWALMVPYDEPDRPEDYTMEVATKLVRKAIGTDSIPFEITSVGNWNMSAQVADRYRADRLFLTGDAAHRFPPSGGLGLNTGVQDAHNLAWKLAAVLSCKADPALLETYEEERRNIALVNCEQSVTNSMKISLVDQALGVSSFTPVRPQDALSDQCQPLELGLEGDTDLARERRLAVQAAIDMQLEHFDSFGLDLGVTYDAGALCCDGSAPVHSTVQDYFPNTRPGARLPHIWFLAGGRRKSSFDYVDPLGFTLFTCGEGVSWKEAANKAAERLCISIRVVTIGEGCDLEDPDGRWLGFADPAAYRAVLVRPDGHVGARLVGAARDEFEDLTAALSRILGLSSAPGPHETDPKYLPETT